MTLFTRYTRKITTAFIAVFLISCGGGNNEPSPTDNGKDRQEVLVHWVDNIVIPSYDKFKVKLDTMKAKANAFTENANVSTLTEFRAAWVDAYLEWQKVEVFEFGPADQYTLRSFFNIYPTDVNGIATNINDASINLDLPASYARQGFPALDYLINGVGADDAQIIAYYTADVEGVKRLAYVTRVVERMRTLLMNVISGWPAYRNTFISKTGLDIGSSFGLVVNSYVLYYERYIRSGKIGIPSGATFATGGTINPDKVEAYYKKDMSLALAKNAHNAAVDFFNGKNAINGVEGPSFKSYLDALGSRDASTGTALSEIINTQFSTISDKLDLLGNDFSQQVQTDNQVMIDTFTEMQKAVRMLKVDMTSAMSITITYTDNDGD